MNKFYRTEHYLSINGDAALNMYGCLSREGLHYSEIPNNEDIIFDDVSKLKSFIEQHGNQFYNKQTIIGKRSYIKWDDGWGSSHRYYDDKFKSAHYAKVHIEIDLSNESVNYLMRELCADDFARWLRDNGVANCPILTGEN